MFSPGPVQTKKLVNLLISYPIGCYNIRLFVCKTNKFLSEITFENKTKHLQICLGRSLQFFSLPLDRSAHYLPLHLHSSSLRQLISSQCLIPHSSLKHPLRIDFHLSHVTCGSLARITLAHRVVENLKVQHVMIH